MRTLAQYKDAKASTIPCSWHGHAKECAEERHQSGLVEQLHGKYVDASTSGTKEHRTVGVAPRPVQACPVRLLDWTRASQDSSVVLQ